MRTITKRYLLPAIPVTLLVAATATLAKTETTKSNSQVESGTTIHSHQTGSREPQVDVNGHKVQVPANGSTTLKQGDTETTVSHQQSNDEGQPDSSSIETKNDSVSVSVTSTGSGVDISHNHVNIHSFGGGSTTNTVTNDIQIQSHGTGSVHVFN